MSTSAFRIDRLLPAACFLAAAVLFASELMTMFDFTPPGGETLQTQSAHARHGNAMFVISAFAILALFVAVSSGSKPAALGVAVMGGIALLVFLINDLPDAGQVGTLNDVRQSYFDAEAVPQAGFWLEMVSAIGLAISGTALATLSPEQLMALRSKSGKTVADKEADAKSKSKASKKSASNGGDVEDSSSSSKSKPTKKAPAPKGN
jgi:hypothetical protein